MLMRAVVLLAGLSLRMGENKMLLPYKGKPLFLSTLETVLSLFADTVCVTGHERERIESILDCMNVPYIYNPDFKTGQRSSMIAALESSDDDFVIVPADLPLLEKDDFSKGLAIIKEGKACRACYNGIPGHPVFIPKRIREIMLKENLPFRTILERENIICYEAGVGSVFDIDTKESYKALLDGNLSLLNDGSKR